MKELAFDVVLHLAGEQILPNYMAIRLCECHHHIIVITEQTSNHINLLKAELGPSFSVIPVLVPAFKYTDILQSFRDAASRTQGRRVGFNITGGTKPMSTAALDFCRETDVTPFYVDTKTHKIHLFKTPFDELPMPPVFSSIDEFCRLAGYSVANPGLDASNLTIKSRAELSRLFWKHKDFVRRWNEVFSAASSAKMQNRTAPPSEFDEALSAMLSRNSKLDELWQSSYPPTADWRPAAKYLAGGWFEEFCFEQLSGLIRQTKLLDLRLGFKAGWEGMPPTNNPFDEAQDMDIAFTDGYELTILECKTGMLKQEYIQKLENLRSVFGGAFGKTVLVSINPPSNKTVLNRIGSSRGVMMVCATESERLSSHAMAVKPGQIFGAEHLTKTQWQRIPSTHA